MIFYVSGGDTDELLMVLEGVGGVVVKRSAERKKRKYFEKGARPDSMGQASAKVFITGEIPAVARAAVVEAVREREIAVTFGSEGIHKVVYVGPSDDERHLQALAEWLD